MDEEFVCSKCGQVDKAGVLISDARKGTRKTYIGPEERLCIPCALERGFPADCALETVTRKIGTISARLAAAETRVAELEGLLRDVRENHLSLDEGSGVGYVGIQICKETWGEIEAALRGKEEQGE